MFLQYTVSVVPRVFFSIPVYISPISIQQYGNTSWYNPASKNTTLNQLKMLQCFITKQIFLNIFRQPLQILRVFIYNSTKLWAISKIRSIQADANKVSLILKNKYGWRWFCDSKDVWRWFENITEVKDYILLTESNKSQMPES